MKIRIKRSTRPGDHSAYRYCVFAVHINDQGDYWYEHKYKMFFHGFCTEAHREEYWQTIVEQQSVPQPGALYEVAMLDVWGRTAAECQRVSQTRYAASPIIDVYVDHRRIVDGLINCTVPRQRWATTRSR